MFSQGHDIVLHNFKNDRSFVTRCLEREWYYVIFVL